MVTEDPFLAYELKKRATCNPAYFKSVSNQDLHSLLCICQFIDTATGRKLHFSNFRISMVRCPDI